MSREEKVDAIDRDFLRARSRPNVTRILSFFVFVVSTRRNKR